MKDRFLMRRWRIILSGLVLFLLLQSITRAQGSSLELKRLRVELWPEYDRPEVLVIYRAELEPDTPLPAQVTFRLPGYLESMHAVAVEQNGVLVEVNQNAIELRREGDELWLTFPTPSPGVQFEYYDNRILTRQDRTRQLTFNFSPPYPTEMVSLEVQEPFQVEGFSLMPEADNSFVGNDGLRYHTIEVTDLAPTETFTLTATYQRNTDELSATQASAEGISEHAPDIAVITETPINQNLTIGYILMGVGIILLLGTGGYWWWSRRVKEAARPRRQKSIRPPHRQKGGRAGRSETGQKAGSAAPTPLVRPTSPGQFCYRCGSALREEANFCHVCGAERRRE